MKFRFVVFLVDLASRRGCTGAGVGLSWGWVSLPGLPPCAQTYFSGTMKLIANSHHP